VKASWEFLTDQEYQSVLSGLNKFIEEENYSSLRGDEAYNEIAGKLPLRGYIFSAPRHKLFSAYDSGGENKTIGYSIDILTQLNRIECVVANKQLTFACVFNHEWQALCPELYVEKNT
jgi:hypothetical protein